MLASQNQMIWQVVSSQFSEDMVGPFSVQCFAFSIFLRVRVFCGDIIDGFSRQDRP